MGIIWDFGNKKEDFLFPMITGVFYCDSLSKSNWGAISGIKGRNTKVCSILVSGKIKMANTWVMVSEKHWDKYISILKKR
jgi:hypothetical protein